MDQVVHTDLTTHSTTPRLAIGPEVVSCSRDKPHVDLGCMTFGMALGCGRDGSERRHGLFVLGDKGEALHSKHHMAIHQLRAAVQWQLQSSYRRKNPEDSKARSKCQIRSCDQQSECKIEKVPVGRITQIEESKVRRQPFEGPRRNWSDVDYSVPRTSTIADQFIETTLQFCPNIHAILRKTRLHAG